MSEPRSGYEAVLKNNLSGTNGTNRTHITDAVVTTDGLLCNLLSHMNVVLHLYI